MPFPGIQVRESGAEGDTSARTFETDDTLIAPNFDFMTSKGLAASRELMLKSNRARIIATFTMLVRVFHQNMFCFIKKVRVFSMSLLCFTNWMRWLVNLYIEESKHQTKRLQQYAFVGKTANGETTYHRALSTVGRARLLYFFFFFEVNYFIV